MSLFNYNIDIPATNNSPSNDQPLMKINTNSINGIWNQDHYGFNDAKGGYHKIIHQPQANGNVDPATIANIGQTYVKKPSTDEQLFFMSGLGVVYNLCTVPISGNGSLALTAAVYATIVPNLPQECSGFLTFSYALGGCLSAPFFTTGGVLYCSASITTGPLTFRFQPSGGPNIDLQIRCSSSLTTTYKYIYWTV